jgi:serine/threonine-protein phosphatase PP1 catalytic subunit
MAECDVDNIIDQLLGVRGARPGRQVNLTENEIKWLCTKGREIFQQQPVLLELEAPIKVGSLRSEYRIWSKRGTCGGF